jgi:hypothetical protein
MCIVLIADPASRVSINVKGVTLNFSDFLSLGQQTLPQQSHSIKFILLFLLTAYLFSLPAICGPEH